MPTGGKVNPISSSLVDLVASGLVETVRGVTSATWFGPGQPLPSVGPSDLKLRQLDYQYGFNLQTQPRITESGVSYDQLINLADSYDLLRLVIETRKDQIEAMPHTFRLRAGDGESTQSRNQRSLSDPRVKALNQMFRYPDGEHDWKIWLRAFLEDVFVIDALTLAPKYMLDGSISGLDLIDGATIVRKIDEQGRTPAAPSVAYQQIIKGVPAKDLTTRDIIYRPRNYRTRRVYGFGPVEQILITVNMALRRQQSQLAHFTDGNLPEAIAQVPDSWTRDDLLKFQRQFDLLAGNAAKRSRLRFVPKMDGMVFTKEKMLQDSFDEWLARIVCFCFSISPAAFVKMMNRATSQTQQDAALQEGLFPIQGFISATLDYFVERYIGLSDIEHAFLDDEEADRLKQAQIDKIYASYGKESVDEQRERDGQDPIGLSNMQFTATGPIPLAPFTKGGPMAEGLPQHSKTPQELDQEKQENIDRQERMATLPAAPAPAEKRLKKRKPNFY